MFWYRVRALNIENDLQYQYFNIKGLWLQNLLPIGHYMQYLKLLSWIKPVPISKSCTSILKSFDNGFEYWILNFETFISKFFNLKSFLWQLKAGDINIEIYVGKSSRWSHAIYLYIPLYTGSITGWTRYMEHTLESLIHGHVVTCRYMTVCTTLTRRVHRHLTSISVQMPIKWYISGHSSGMSQDIVVCLRLIHNDILRTIYTTYIMCCTNMYWVQTY
jgi:hypothetical protein